MTAGTGAGGSWSENATRGLRDTYIQNRDLTAALDAAARRESPVEGGALIVSGPPGAGKSTLLTWWSDDWLRRNPTAFVLCPGPRTRSSRMDHVDVIRRVMMAVNSRFGLDEQVPTHRDAIEEGFASWLARVQSDPLVLVLDGLEGLRTSGRSLAWLPDYVQPMVRLIVSADDGEVLDRLRLRGWHELRLNPLTVVQRVEIARRYLAQHRRELRPDVLERVASSRHSANPLFLRTSLDQVSIPADGASLDDRVAHYLAATSIEDLFSRVLDRISDTYGEDPVRDLLTMIDLSRRGLSREDLATALRLKPDQLDGLLRSLDSHLVETDGLISFGHARFRAATRARWPLSDSARRRARGRIVRLVESASSMERVADEVPWQLRQMADADGLLKRMSRLEFVDAMFRRDEGYELLETIVWLGRKFDPAQFCLRAIESLEGSAADPDWMLAVGERLGRLMIMLERPSDAAYVLGRLLDRSQDWLERTDPRRISCLTSLGCAWNAVGEYGRAEELLQLAATAAEESHSVKPQDVVRCRRALAGLLYDVGRRTESGALLLRAFEDAEEMLGSAHATTTEVQVDLAAALFQLGETDRAVELLRNALARSERAFGDLHPTTAKVLNNFASVLSVAGDVTEAILMLQRAAAINERAVGPRSIELAANLTNLGVLLKRAGDDAAAEVSYRRALEIYEATRGAGHIETAAVRFNFGLLLRQGGRAAEALEHLEQAHAARLRVFGSDRIETARALAAVGQARKDLGHLQLAMRHYAEALEVYRSVLGDDHFEVARILDAIRDMAKAGAS